MDVSTVIGDTAYSEKDNIAYAKTNEFELVAKLNPQIAQGSRKKEDEFQFNKDAGMYVKPATWRFGKRGKAKKVAVKTKAIRITSTSKSARDVHLKRGLYRMS